MRKYLLFTLALLLANFSFSQFLKNKENIKKHEGFFNFYYAENDGKLFLEVDKLNTEFLYVYSLSHGVGSNDIGLDRGQLGNEQVVFFKKSGNKLFLVQPNLKFRANSDNELEKRSVEQAFASSVLFGFKIEEVQNGRYIIDFTPFLLRDAHGVANKLKRAKQGTYKLDEGKSTLEMKQTRTFPKNSEFEAMLTFSGEADGAYIRSVAPDPDLITVVQHHSFIELPDNNYKPRAFDPRSGSLSVSYMDYATPVYEPIQKQYIIRHRLEKKDPEAAVSEAVEPIVYYLDNGAPEPVRSALMEGASWWNQAFEAIGYKNAFQVKILPEDADPMDVRYNVIQWVHRSTRGWSYGSTVIDPRTGEILKGHVSLGSLRIRQDYLIAQGLMDRPFAESDDNYEPMMDLALARIRQLAAHEVGHTLGFAHNFAASVTDRASVMDYPHPQLSLKRGKIDFSNAYDTGIGEWDKVALAYSYESFPKNKDERKELDKILTEAFKEGHRFISDSDARSQAGAHPYAHLWDGGADPVKELKNILDIRKVAIENFSEDNIRSGEAYSVLEDVFVPVYLLHRYQTEAVSKIVGGIDYNYLVKGDPSNRFETVSVGLQKQALQALLSTLEPEILAIPKEKLSLFPPRAYGYPRTRESFKSNNGVAFDPLGAADTASDMTLAFLLNPERANRLVEQKSLDKDQLGLEEVIGELLSKTIEAKPLTGYEGDVQRTVNYNVLKGLMSLAASDKSRAVTDAVVNQELSQLKNRLQQGAQNAFTVLLQNEIERFMNAPEEYKRADSLPIPDGSPIGMDCFLN